MAGSNRLKLFGKDCDIAKALRLNERIRITPVRVIDQHQEQLGVIPTHEALTLAREAGLDLVEVSPTENPPVCRIIDYGKHIYEKKKRLKVSASSHVVSLKEIRIRPKTDKHDREIKMNRARNFLAEDHKVQFTMLFRGRERFHRDRAHVIFKSILAELGETVKVERTPSMEGRRMTMVVAPAKRQVRSKQVSKAPPEVEQKKLKQAAPAEPTKIAPTSAPEEVSQPQSTEPPAT